MAKGENRNSPTVRQKDKVILSRAVKGRDGWNFIMRDIGQTISIADYSKIYIPKYYRGSGPHTPGVSRYDSEKYKETRDRVFEESMNELKMGRYIHAPVFISLCNKYKISVSPTVKNQCTYISNLEISTRTLRHKNADGPIGREKFKGIFLAVEQLVALAFLDDLDNQ